MSNTNKTKIIVLAISYVLALTFIILAILPLFETPEKEYYSTGTHTLNLEEEYTIFEFKFEKTGMYTFKSEGESDTQARLTLRGSTCISSDDIDEDNKNFEFQYRCEKGEIYRLCIKSNSGSLENYKIKVTAVKANSNTNNDAATDAEE